MMEKTEYSRDELDAMADEQLQQAKNGDRWKRAGCAGNLRVLDWSIERDRFDSIDFYVTITCDEREAIRKEHTLIECVNLWHC